MKKKLSVPNYGPQDQKICKISAVHKTITLFYFGFKFLSVILYPCTNSLFFCGIMAKNRICPDLPEVSNSICCKFVYLDRLRGFPEQMASFWGSNFGTSGLGFKNQIS